jgi:hypothetical protein
MINSRDEYAVWAYEMGFAMWFKLKDRFEDLTHSDPHYRLGYITAMKNG